MARMQGSGDDVQDHLHQKFRIHHKEIMHVFECSKKDNFFFFSEVVNFRNLPPLICIFFTGRNEVPLQKELYIFLHIEGQSLREDLLSQHTECRSIMRSYLQRNQQCRLSATRAFYQDKQWRRFLDRVVVELFLKLLPLDHRAPDLNHSPTQVASRPTRNPQEIRTEAVNTKISYINSTE